MRNLTLAAITLFVFSCSSAKPLKIVRDPAVSHDDYVMDIRFSPDGNTLASGGYDSHLMLWNRRGTAIKKIEGDFEKIFAIHWISPDRIITANYGGQVILWNLQEEKIERKILLHDDFVSSLDYDAESGLLVTAGWDRTIKVMEFQRFLDTGEGVKSCVPQGAPIVAIRFLPGGRIIGANTKGQVKLWSVDSCESKTERVQGIHEAPIIKMELSPDKKYFLTASSDGTAIIAKVEMLKHQQTLRGHEGPVNAAVFSPSGETVATGGADGTIYIWNLKGKKVGKVAAHTSDVYALEFHPDGNTLASGSYDNTVKFWDVRGIVP